ncbi:MAG TPA: dihydroneopterin aldolase [Nocardioidaceae bacterium]|nr:dihydroneopterin aldolase [Nocardioidaceae bacterium]
MTRTSDEAGDQTRGCSDRLAVRGIEITGYHGVFDFERREGQRFVVDLVLGLDTRPAALSDDLQDTVDYGTLVTAVVHAVESDPVSLIESLVQRIADVCLSDARVAWVEVTVHKPEAPVPATFADVTLTVRRTRPAGPLGPPEPGVTRATTDPTRTGEDRD